MNEVNRMVSVRPMTPPRMGDVLQPLREVGSLDKTQFWDFEEIQAALREARVRGIRPESLYARQPRRGRSREEI